MEATASALQVALLHRPVPCPATARSPQRRPGAGVTPALGSCGTRPPEASIAASYHAPLPDSSAADRCLSSSVPRSAWSPTGPPPGVVGSDHGPRPRASTSWSRAPAFSRRPVTGFVTAWSASSGERSLGSRRESCSECKDLRVALSRCAQRVTSAGFSIEIRHSRRWTRSLGFALLRRRAGRGNGTVRRLSRGDPTPALAPFVDPDSQSPGESILRLRWLDVGLPRPRCQVEVPAPGGAATGSTSGWRSSASAPSRRRGLPHRG